MVQPDATQCTCCCSDTKLLLLCCCSAARNGQSTSGVSGWHNAMSNNRHMCRGRYFPQVMIVMGLLTQPSEGLAKHFRTRFASLDGLYLYFLQVPECNCACERPTESSMSPQVRRHQLPSRFFLCLLATAVTAAQQIQIANSRGTYTVLCQNSFMLQL